MLWGKPLPNFVPLIRRLVINKPAILPKCANCRKVSTEVNTNVVKDVLLYKYENTKFYTLMGLFGVCQVGFWFYLSYFAFNFLRDVPGKEGPDARWYEKINLGSNKYRFSLTCFSLLLGKLYRSTR